VGGLLERLHAQAFLQGLGRPEELALAVVLEPPGAEAALPRKRCRYVATARIGSQLMAALHALVAESSSPEHKRTRWGTLLLSTCAGPPEGPPPQLRRVLGQGQDSRKSGYWNGADGALAPTCGPA